MEEEDGAVSLEKLWKSYKNAHHDDGKSNKEKKD
jgi:hypothetical protein